MPASPNTLLRRVKQDEANPKPAPPPRVVGTDGRAIEKGHRHGAIAVDLERGAALDLLPGRDGDSLKDWLRRYPQVEWVSRGRRAEFEDFGWRPEDVPDPQDEATYRRSQLDWSEIGVAPHAEVLELYRSLIALRRFRHG